MGPSPILWNQSKLPKELPGPLNLLVLLLSRQSACFTLPPFLFCTDLQQSQGGAFFPLSISPSTTAELFSCRKGSFIRLHTQESPTASRGPSLLSFFAHSFFLSDKPHSVLSKKRKKQGARTFCFDTQKYFYLHILRINGENWAVLHKSQLLPHFLLVQTSCCCVW